MSDVLEHIPNTEKLFEEVFRVLKKWWIILFDFAPYYHYFWHHIWDTIRIPWLHLFTTEKFRIKLYKESVKNYPDSNKRISLRIWVNQDWKESFDYLNRISRKNFENVIKLYKNKWYFSESKIKYFMLKGKSFLSRLPILREVFIKHILWFIIK
jgi:hypothetical protein